MNHKVAFSFADGKTLFFPVQGNEILLDAALRNGIKIPLDCREGVCGTCMGRCELFRSHCGSVCPIPGDARIVQPQHRGG